MENVVEKSLARRFTYSVDTQPTLSLFTVNNGNIGTMLKSVQSYWRHFSVFIINFKQISHIILVLSLLWCFLCFQVNVCCVLTG